MTRREKQVQRLRKLLALARSPNPHEAASARLKADELMAEHGLGEKDVAAPTTGDLYELALGGSGWSSLWRVALVTAAARHCGAEAVVLVHGRVHKVRLVGERADVERAQGLFEEMLRALAEVERTATRELGSTFRLAVVVYGRRAAADSFRQGAALGILHRLARTGRAAAGTSEVAVRSADRTGRAREKYASTTRDAHLEDVVVGELFEIGLDVAKAIVRVSQGGHLEVKVEMTKDKEETHGK